MKGDFEYVTRSLSCSYERADYDGEQIVAETNRRIIHVRYY